MLVNMRRTIGETLRLYTERNWEVYNLIPDCDQSVAAESFMNGLDPSSTMFQDLSRNPSKTMGELMVTLKKITCTKKRLSNIAHRRHWNLPKHQLLLWELRSRWLTSSTSTVAKTPTRETQSRTIRTGPHSNHNNNSNLGNKQGESRGQRNMCLSE